jgi:RNA recognition motif-containing protein
MMNIYVGNLSSEATEDEIRKAFETFGEVASARIIKDKYTGQSRGFGFVEMPGQSQALTAIKDLNGKDLMGKEITVNEARPKTNEGRTGGRMDFGGKRNRY